jgi:hypothetical protein
MLSAIGLSAEGSWMGMAVSGRAGGARRNTFQRLGVGLAAATLLGLCVAGCATAPQAPAAYASAASPRGPTVAFDSIDGPPETIFQQLVQDLSDEAAARQMAVVSRESSAQYRVRGYLAALVNKKRATVISWVWDVYDANQQRALRISGEEPARSGRGTWAAADEQVLRRIAKTGMDRLAAFLAAPGAEPAPPATPDSRGPNVATNGPAGGNVASPVLALSADAR